MSRVNGKRFPSPGSSWLLLLIGLLALAPSAASEPAETAEAQAVSATEGPAVEIDPRLYFPRHQGLRRGTRPLQPIELAAIENRRLDEFRTAKHEYLRFDTPPSVSLRRLLRRQGILLTGYVGDRTYVAAVNERGREHLAVAPGITSAGPIPVEDKLQRKLLEGEIGSWATDGPGRILVDVRFHENVALVDARATVEAHGGIVLDDAAWFGFSLLQASLGAGSYFDLAASDLVLKLSLKSPEPAPMNQQAAQLSEVDVLWQPPYDLSGAGYTVGVWDAGRMYDHPEFASRIVFAESVPQSAHSTHVTGTIAASGNLGEVSFAAHGMANQVSIKGYDFFSYNVEFVNEIIGGGMHAANNGWGYAVGWYFWPGCPQYAGCTEDLDPPQCPACPDWLDLGNGDQFGVYGLDSWAIDTAAEFAERTGKTFPIVFSAGNERDDGPPGEHDGTEFPNPDVPTNPYYDTLTWVGCAKNSITVGAVDGNMEMTDYSSWGPCDDGRIKPDLVAKGHGLYSSYGPNEYQILTGTSMASGVVTGSAVLVTEQFQNTFGFPPFNGELKALLINSTLDLGPPGPDYVYGYGLLQTQAAVDLIRSEDGAATVEAGSLFQTQTHSYNVEISQGTPTFKCTLAWMDEPGVEDSPAPDLVNDLDLRLISPSQVVHYPFSLNVNDPVAVATATGPNTVDTVEQIVVDNPETGTWTIEVHGQSVPAPPQTYGLAANRVIAAPKLFDVLPPNVLNGYPYPYRYPILSAKFVDPSGLGIDPDSVEIHLLWIDVTDDAVITADGFYYEVPWELWEGQQDFTVSLANLDGLQQSTTSSFDLVETQLVEDLTVARGAGGEAILNWAATGYYSPTLVPPEFRIYRSTDLQQELEWIGTVGLQQHTFTDHDAPATGLVTYEVHARFDHLGLYRVLSTRDTPHRTRQPFIASPRGIPFDSVSGETEVRILGMSEPGSEVTVYVDDVAVGSTTALVDASFALTHDLGAPGQYTFHVQAKAAGKSLSVPSVEVLVDVLP